MLILTKPARLADLASLADPHPDVDIVVDHMANRHQDDNAHRRSLLELARFPGIYVKISHPWSDTFGPVKEVYHAYGPERLM